MRFIYRLLHHFFYSTKRIVKLALIIIVSWLFGFFTFYSFIPDQYNYSNEHTDAVIVLTGGKGRIEAGINAFFKFKAKKLLISGVGGGLTRAAIIRKIHVIKPDYVIDDEIIVLGNISNSTFTNAIESRIFLDLNHLNSYRIITSSYHYPRVKYIFEHMIPNKKLVMHPVFSSSFTKKSDFITRSSLRLSVMEYNKMIFAVFMVFADNLDIEWKNAMYVLVTKVKEKLA